MKLHWSPRSPFVRKVMIVLIETGLDARVERRSERREFFKTALGAAAADVAAVCMVLPSRLVPAAA